MRVDGVHEGTGPVVDRLARDRDVVGVHDPMNESNEHPFGDEAGLSLDDGGEQVEIALAPTIEFGVVACDCVIGEGSQVVDRVKSGGVLKCANSKVGRRNSDENRSW